MPYDEYNVPQEKNNGNHLCGAVRVGRDSLTSNSLFIFASGRKKINKNPILSLMILTGVLLLCVVQDEMIKKKQKTFVDKCNS